MFGYYWILFFNTNSHKKSTSAKWDYLIRNERYFISLEFKGIFLSV
ncbi:hypothetical protein C1A50_1999 [Paenibacillus polymyxa]|nr:hypothetical protein C1A50_1999 [Paenibacillus polymyxa]